MKSNNSVASSAFSLVLLCILKLNVLGQSSGLDPQAILSSAEKEMSQIPSFKAELVTDDPKTKSIEYLSNVNGLPSTRLEIYSRVVGSQDTPIVTQIRNGENTWCLLPGKALKMDIHDKAHADLSAAMGLSGATSALLIVSGVSVKPIEDATGKYYLITEKVSEDPQVKAQIEAALQSKRNKSITLPSVASKEMLIGQNNYFIYRTTLKDALGKTIFNNELDHVDMNPHLPDSLFEVPKGSKIYIISNSEDYLNAISDRPQ